MFLFSILIIFSSSILFSALFKFKSRVSYLLSIYIFSYGNIALIGNIGHFLSLLGNPVFFLVSQMILFLLLLLIWIKQKKPSLAGPFKQFLNSMASDKIIRFAKENFDLTLMFLGVTIGFIVLAYVWYVVPPNNNDSISTHLPRVVYWIQHGNFLPWDTARIFQLMYPVNSGLQFLWTILLTKSDHWVGLVQWTAAIVSAISIYGISSILGSKLPGRLFSGLIFLTLPAVVMQSTTTQNDLTAAALFGVFYYFFIQVIRCKSIKNLYLAAFTVALVIGTKQTILYILPGFGIIFLMFWLKFRFITFKQIFIFSGIVILTFLVIGSSIFFINLDYFGHPLGGKEVVSSSIQATKSVQSSVSQISLNSLRFLYQMADPTGLSSPFWRWGIKLRALVGKEIFSLLQIPIEADSYNTWPHKFNLSKAYLYQEDESWFGILGFLILIPTFIIQTIIGFRKKEPVRISIFILSFSFLLLLTLLRPGWDPYQGRYFLPIVLICTSLASSWFSIKYLRWIMGPLSVLLGLMIFYNGILYNPAKPLLDRPILIFYRYPEDPGYEQIRKGNRINELNRLEKLSFQTFSNFYLCDFIDQHVPQNAILGYAISEDYYQEYCFFGDKFTRILVPIYPIEKIKQKSYLIKLNIEYLLLYKASEFEGIVFDEFSQIAFSSDPDVVILKRNLED
jgi:hypothetical protein